MKLDQPAAYRKTVVQWYDSEAVCLVVIVFLFVVVLFGLAGITVATSTPQYQKFLWVPVLLTVLSSGVIGSITIRLIRRFIARFRRKDV